MKITFESDYITGAHPAVLENLIRTNAEPMTGYGADPLCLRAAEKIKAACACPGAAVHFIAGGTQTNAIVLGAVLRDYEGVLSAVSGHINGHEAGAIEYSGHKVIGLAAKEGKISADAVAAYMDGFLGDEAQEHLVRPGAVYISQPTEYGTVYGLDELTRLSDTCHRYGLTLYADGARLGYALEAVGADVTLPDMARLCDIFYIGGTKVGALCGEAVVFTRGNMPPHFFTSVKKRGGILAKGRLLGAQFDALFTDGLYADIGRHAVGLSQKMAKIFTDAGYQLLMASPTNQQFPIMDDQTLGKLGETVGYSHWERLDANRSVARFATCWSTTEEDLEILRAALEQLGKPAEA